MTTIATRPDPPETDAPGIGATIDASIDLVGNLIGNVERLVTGVRRDGVRIARDSQALYRATAGRAGAMKDVVRAGPRMFRIVKEGMAIIGRYKLHQSRARHLSEERAAAALEKLHRSSARKLYRMCVELRGGVLKVGQFISARMDLLPHAYIEELSGLQDRVPAVAYEDILGVLESELGQPIDELFADFDPEPIAAASLAQVHRAVLPDGVPVAVKVQVPGIGEVIETDIAALRILAAAAADLVPQTDMTTICAELARAIRHELDFRTEAESLTEFWLAFEEDDDVVVPEVIEVYSSERVLTMELIEGERMIEFLDGAEPAEQATLFGTLIRVYCEQVLRDGRFQADPHPGNFLVAPGPRLCLLDFGCVGRLSSDQIAAYKQIAMAVLAQDSKQVAELLGRAGFATLDGSSDSLVQFADLMLEQFREGAADWQHIDPREQLERAMELARDNPVVEVPAEFVLLGRVFGTLGGLVLHYKPDIDLFKIIAPHLMG